MIAPRLIANNRREVGIVSFTLPGLPAAGRPLRGRCAPRRSCAGWLRAPGPGRARSCQNLAAAYSARLWIDRRAQTGSAWAALLAAWAALVELAAWAKEVEGV